MVGSEDDSIECWENYTAGEVLVQGLAGQIHQQDVEAIIRAQKQMWDTVHFSSPVIYIYLSKFLSVIWFNF